MSSRRRIITETAIALALFALPLMVFWPQTMGGRTLLPSENLYQYEPLATYREVANAPSTPHNHLLSDLVLQNMQWKAFIRQQVAAGEIPLWNPHQFGGIPFLAAGQSSALYPLSALYYLLPLTAAYGWFTVVNLGLAGWLMYVFLRGIGAGRAGGMLGGVVYQLCGFMLASVVFPMIIGAAVWLPLLLLMAEYIARARPLWRGGHTPIPWVAIGGVALACNILAGHAELTIYTLLITGYYTVARLLWLWWRLERTLAQSVISGLWSVAMVALGFALAGVQFIPLLEFAQTNWRSERSSIETVLSYAHPLRDVIQFIMPNFYGSPAHHSYFDVFRWQTVTELSNAAGERIAYIDWGIKNYVEGALYVGILPLALAGLALWPARGGKRSPYIFIFGGLALVSLSFMFGMPTYRLLYPLPGINQLNSPFRWVFGVTVAIAALAGLGWDKLEQEGGGRRLGQALGALGALTLAGLALSRLLYEQIAPLVDRVFRGMALAENAFADARMFYSYQLVNALILGAMMLGAGLVLWQAGRRPKRAALWAIALTAADLMLATGGFNPSSDPLLLDFTPPSVQWLQGQKGDWRYITLEDPAQRPILNANMGMRYGLDDVRGYDSIISKTYVDYMRALAPQRQLDFNRIAPLFIQDLPSADPEAGGVLAPNNPLLDLLNVRYVIGHKSIRLHAADPAEAWPLVYEDEAVRIWQNPSAVPRAYVVAVQDFRDAWLPNAAGSFDYSQLAVPEAYTPVDILHDSGREKILEVRVDSAAWLVISESYAPGWRAFVRPSGAGEAAETAQAVEWVLGNFQGVRLDVGAWTVRLVYSPPSFQVGLFASIIGVAIVAFLLGAWFWRAYVGLNTAESSQAARVARNSIAPILLNLFNRGIDFAFAIVMLRLLSPQDVGIYYFAVVVFVWFDIFTNFGLDLFLIREAARAREQAGYYLYNTSFLRFFLSVLGVGLLAGFLLVWQMGNEPLPDYGLWALILLYVGLFPSSLSKGLSSLFYAHERAEYPAAIATITTINKAIFGVIALLLGWGIVGLAGVSIANNLLTLGVLVWSARALIGKVRLGRPDVGLLRGMVRESWPLMLNHFLATIFFQIDVVILQALKGAVVVAQYSVAYRWLLAINVIPAFFTQALLPLMSRQAREDRAALRRNYTLALKLLVALALPLAVVFTLLAEPLTYLLGGAEYLPNGAIALQLMIWSIPIGWMNSLTQYVLVAVDLQRRITGAFVVAVAFNIGSNLLFIPSYSFVAAAITTIFSEGVLFIAFAVLLQSALGKLPWAGVLWRPLAATVAMLIATLALQGMGALLALAAGCGVYLIVLLGLKPLSDEELELLAPILPRTVRYALRLR